MLKIRGGSSDQITSFLEKMGMANSDGSVTERYRKFLITNNSRRLYELKPQECLSFMKYFIALKILSAD
jgi:hypothetical protein